jgi:DNA mismatch repair protein MutH
MDTKRIVEVLEMIATDMVNDAKDLDGKPFNGRTVAEALGNQGAAIATLARIIKTMAENLPTKNA